MSGVLSGGFAAPMPYSESQGYSGAASAPPVCGRTPLAGEEYFLSGCNEFGKAAHKVKGNLDPRSVPWPH